MQSITFQSAPLTEETLSDLYSEWLNLAHCAIEKNVFFFPWFVHASIPLLEPKQPQIVTIYQEGLLIGLTIMQSDTGYAKVPVGFFRSCLQYHQFLATPLIRNGYAKEFFSGIGAWLDASPHNKSFCVLSLLTGEGEISDAADEVFEQQKRSVSQVETFERAAIIGSSTETASITDHISKSRSKNLKRREKSLAKLGEVAIEHFSQGDDDKEWLDDFIRLENSGWKGEAKTSIAENPIDQKFYHEMVASAASEGSLSLIRLSIDGVPIAYTLDLACGPFVYCLKSAHDASYRKYAPGVILEYETLKKYRQSGIDIFVDSCTSPDNTMLNELWPDRRKIRSIAFARTGGVHGIIFKSVFLLKQAINNKPSLKWKER